MSITCTTNVIWINCQKERDRKKGKSKAEMGRQLETRHGNGWHEQPHMSGRC